MIKSTTPQINIACGAICEKDGKILMVRENRKDEGMVLNQPVGLLELNEDICKATLREIKEETGLDVKLTNFLGVYVWLLKNGNTSIRFCFIGHVLGGELRSEIRTDGETIEPIWLSREELRQSEELYRNVVTKKCLEDYFSGISYPLDAVRILRDCMNAQPSGSLDAETVRGLTG